MNTKIFWLIFLLLLFLCFTFKCAIPGSGLTMVAVDGIIFDEKDNPDQNFAIEFILPAGYGLSGLDAYWGKPEDYGHTDQGCVLESDSLGRFKYSFEPTTYSISCLIIPPLGALPRYPPKPYIAFRFTDYPNQIYALRIDDDMVDYQIYDREQKRYLSKNEDPILSKLNIELIQKKDMSYKKDEEMKIRGWLMKLTIILKKAGF